MRLLSFVLSFILSTMALLTDAAMLFLIALRYPDNHGMWPIPLLQMFLSLLLVMGLLPAVWCRHRATLVTLLLCLLGLFMCWAADYFNIMMEYEVWIDRGMPAWGERR